MNKINWPHMKEVKPALYNFIISKFGNEEQAEKNLAVVQTLTALYDSIFGK